MKRLSILSILFAILIFASDSYGCGCISIVIDEEIKQNQEADYNQDIQKTLVNRAIEKADIIIVGEVVELEFSQATIDNRPATRYAHFQVSKTWKGIEENFIVVSTSNRDFACGVRFQKGQNYLVYASKIRSGATTNLCTRTQIYREDNVDERYLGEPMKTHKEEKIETSPRKIQ